jgi:hypothetical protein
MADVSKTDRSVNGRDTDRLFALHAEKDGRSPHGFQLQRAEPAIEAQHPKVGQRCLMGEGSGRELRCGGNFGSIADDLSKRREERRDAMPCLPRGDGGLGVTRELPVSFLLAARDL